MAATSVEVARASGEHLHRDEILGAHDGHTSVADDALLRPSEELLLETRAGEDHVDGDPGRPMDEG